MKVKRANNSQRSFEKEYRKEGLTSQTSKHMIKQSVRGVGIQRLME